MKKILLVATFIGLAGCRTSVLPALAYQRVTTPEVGAIATVGVGEQLLTQGDGFAANIITISTDQTIGDYVVRQGKYRLSGDNKEYMTYSGVSIRNNTKGVDKVGNLYLFHKDQGTKIACISRSICDSIEYGLDQQMTYTKANFQQTLIYSGKVGEKITLGYREFSGDLARPAFNNDVVYDIAVSRIVGYKGARIEVISASNTEITYKVLSDFR
jgi:hypothetical protein